MPLEIIMYHYVRPILLSSYPNIKGLEVDGFIRQIEFFKKTKHVVSTAEVLCAFTEKSKLPNNSVWLTFDDGYKDHYKYVAPILENFGFDAAFFPVSDTYTSNVLLDVNTIHFILASMENEKYLINLLKKEMLDEGFSTADYNSLWSSIDKSSRHDTETVIFIKRILQRELPLEMRQRIIKRIFETVVGKSQNDLSKELYMSKSEIASLANRGFTIGSHTASHKWLNHLGYDEQVDEIDRSMNALFEINKNLDNWIMCYPYGGYNNNTLEILGEKGCALALTTHVGSTDTSSDHKFELPRLDTNDFPQ